MAVGAGVVQGIVVAVTGLVVGLVVGGLFGDTGAWVGAAIVGVLSALAAIPYGRAIAKGKVYGGTRGVAVFVVDATWSALNTWGGALYHLPHWLARNPLDVAKTQGTGSIWLTNGVSSRYATTIGIVKAGSSEYIDRHEEVHVFQGRLLGPLYLPLVGVNYVIATILPYWAFSSTARKDVSGFWSYFERGVYPNVFNELWARAVAGH